MKSLHYLLLLLLLSLCTTACQDTPQYKDDALGNFDALSEIVATRYCFLEEKGIDWPKVSAQWRDSVKGDIGGLRLFSIMSRMLDTLEDGHVNLSSYFNTYSYRKWWTDYPQDFNLRCLQQYYLDFDYFTTSGIYYKMLPDSIGYMYYPSFANGIGRTNLDYIMAILHTAKGLIVDVRNNGGGLLTNVDVLMERFVTHEITGGYISHKTGPGPDDFSEPYPMTYHPADPRRICWEADKPVAVLTNRSCFSAANNFVSVMKQLPNVRIIGAKTGGGGGLPFSSELPNGWWVRFSACPVFDSEMRSIEYGIDPSPGCEVHATEEDFAAGYDPILDFALRMLSQPETN